MARDEPILIKRYANRKLYDQGRSRYVTLEELEDSIRQGREIRVVDAVSGEDLTGQTLAQIILDTARGRRTTLPAARSTSGSRAIALSGGGTIAGGPTTTPIGSTRSSVSSRRSGGNSSLIRERIADSCTDLRSSDCPGR